MRLAEVDFGILVFAFGQFLGAIHPEDCMLLHEPWFLGTDESAAW
jgi:hypothetical protein